jgi:hypothetical protein
MEARADQEGLRGGALTTLEAMEGESRRETIE